MFKNKPAILLDWFHGKTIEQCGKFDSIKEFLTIAREIVYSIDALHKHNINHLNLTTSNILVNVDTKAIKIIGFTSATNYEAIRSDVGYNKRLGRCSNYIPPEQTGSCNLLMDLRSDLYDIGMIFFHMLLGNYCYENKNNDDDQTKNLVHNSLFNTIPPLNYVDPTIPTVTSDMVAKLLQKDPGLRYQSANGLLYDIDLIKDEYKSSNSLSSNKIKLAEYDFPTKLFVPQKLYGRKSEANILHSAFDRATSNGSLEVIFINGLSGVGKHHYFMNY